MSSDLISSYSGEKYRNNVCDKAVTSNQLSLDEQLIEIRRNKFLAMPIAGAVAWTGIAISLIFESTIAKCMSVFVGTSAIYYLGGFVSKLTGENLLGKKDAKNLFNTIFLYAVAQAPGVYAIAIPFFMLEAESLTLSVVILTGLMCYLFLRWSVIGWVSFMR